ncbi:zinc-dependent alcohol dehydrogenase family protein [Aliifodinibius sp. S!AR15-10]|uniref:zinc-dependent alcohol dehydrogenase family protein n=1 Tax=Aliifodinibius sp. S!AR15-10 TaxID=2950437 RepID=UPI0028671B02|nr:zinc-dependent alcohol dehydrogenase family protein [Aliifodinibius sp. S!AR15-10]MDR8392838.1 zinc-dependent alcohol dehydrogenase family protein [Aliifodinibius sp. S!AR15-10]
MRAMVFNSVGEPLERRDMPKPEPSAHQLLIKVSACGVCRTDLHIVDGDLDEPNLPLIPGHQIVGTVQQIGKEVSGFFRGDKVGVPWLGQTCGQCEFCRHEKENLCDNAQFTGYNINGGFAEYAAVDARFCFPVPHDYPDQQAAPLLCAGLIGYRSLRKTGMAQTLGFYGFGSSAHILTQVANYQQKKVFAFTRPRDTEGQDFATRKGAVWAGGSDELPPEKLDAAIIFAPVGPLVPQALKALKKGGTVVCAGIHMSDIPSFPYNILWEERSIESVANLTRRDGQEFLELAPKIPIESNVTTYKLEDANQALNDLREGNFDGSAVLKID